MLEFLYQTLPGRILLKLLTSPAVSIAVGHFLDSGISKLLIPSFVRNNNIDLSICEKTEFDSFNDFFSRKIKEEYRPINQDLNSLICPCDGLLSAYRIDKETVIPVKQSIYTISELLKDDSLSKEFEDGICLVFRLCVNHYHRYAYILSGQKGRNIFIKGRLHTVRPIALRSVPVFTENSREYTVINTSDYGKVVQMEVGAMLVGKIENYDNECECVRGKEKGRFLYGGSTIIVLLQKDKVNVINELFEATENGIETPVIMGQVIGKSTCQ